MVRLDMEHGSFTGGAPYAAQRLAFAGVRRHRHPPRKGDVPAYLSEEFFGFFKMVLDAAKEHGMGIRIADDFSMPWSDCFRTLLNQNEKLRARSLVLKESVTRLEGEVFEYAADQSNGAIILAAKVKNLEISLPDVKHLTFSGSAPLLMESSRGRVAGFCPEAGVYS